MSGWMMGEWGADGSELASTLLNLHHECWPLRQYWCCGLLSVGAVDCCQWALWAAVSGHCGLLSVGAVDCCLWTGSGKTPPRQHPALPHSHRCWI